MKKLLVPTDFGANADKAFDFTVQITKQAKSWKLFTTCYGVSTLCAASTGRRNPVSNWRKLTVPYKCKRK